MKLTRKVYATHEEEERDFIIGIVGGLALNVRLVPSILLLGSLLEMYRVPGLWSVTAALLPYWQVIPLLVNIILLTYFAFTRPWLAFGGLTVLALAILLALCLSVFSVITSRITSRPTQCWP
jgi:hypothetical protein